MELPLEEPRFTIGGRVFSARHPLLIAEIGTGHGGDTVKAKELIDAAAASGAGCAKFQYVIADEILHPATGMVLLPGGPVRLYDRFRALEQPPEFYGALKEYAEKAGLLFLCTPFGLASASELVRLGVEALKIASPELNHLELLDAVAAYGLPTFLSTGVSRLADLELALDRFGSGNACVLHCVTSYPAPEEEYNLRILGGLSALFGVPVGVSDHSMDPVLVPALALACGAVAVEKHFCLSRADGGLDDPIALEPQDLARTAEALADAAQAGGDGTIAAMKEEYGPDRVERVLGDGVKRLAPSERENYERTNRSLHATRALAAGTVIGPEDVAAFRTEKVLRPGLHPQWKGRVVGRAVRVPIPAGEGIRFEDL